MEFENAIPNPEYLIKSIAEQGYTLETALADLIDNSISAEATNIEILYTGKNDKLTLFLADNGCGMTESELSDNMKFPSSDVEGDRKKNDLGRFGLGLKTASFSQTRRFTVLSRTPDISDFSSRTWDVNYLRDTQSWRVIKDSVQDINSSFNFYCDVSNNHLEQFGNFKPSTIVIWQGLFKYENFSSSNKQYEYFSNQMLEVASEYLGIVFNKFMTRSDDPLKIRINNIRVKPFDPFKSKIDGDELPRSLGEQEMTFGNDVMKMTGYVLPVSACDNESNWTTGNKSLMDLEGLYIFRGDRIIFFGGWNKIIKREARVKLARLKVEVGNVNDNMLQLNVAKSKITIPFENRRGVLRYIVSLRDEARKEYHNRGVRSKSRKESNEIGLLKKIATTKGAVYELNESHPLLESIRDSLNSDIKKKLDVFVKLINVRINKQRHEEYNPISTEDDADTNFKELATVVEKLKSEGLSDEVIEAVVLKDFNLSINSFNT